MNHNKAILTANTTNPGYGIARRWICRQRWQRKAQRVISARHRELAEMLIVNKMIWRLK